MSEVSFDVSDDDRMIIRAIAARFYSMGIVARASLDVSRTDTTEIQMDVTACHANGCPLRLELLLNADEFDFAHDVLGIHYCINRATGKLNDNFKPAFRVVDRRRQTPVAAFVDTSPSVDWKTDTAPAPMGYESGPAGIINSESGDY